MHKNKQLRPFNIWQNSSIIYIRFLALCDIKDHIQFKLKLNRLQY